jgi:hypothetical protein
MKYYLGKADQSELLDFHTQNFNPKNIEFLGDRQLLSYDCHLGLIAIAI